MRRILILLCLLLICFVPTTHAQDSPPVVYAVLFYSPTCPHCHHFITEQLPSIQAEFGDQLQVLFVDVSQTEGAALFRAAIDQLDVPEDRAGYVPTLVIGATVMVGGTDIPTMMPGLVRDGLAAGGIGLPPVAEIQQAYIAAQAGSGNATNDTTNDTSGNATDNVTDNSGVLQMSYSESDEESWVDRFERDSTGNSLAVLVLGMLLVGLGLQVGGEIQALQRQKPTLWPSEPTRRVWLVALAVLTAGVALTLALENDELSVPMALAGVVLVGLLVVIWRFATSLRVTRSAERLTNEVLPILIVLGLIVAGYLAYIETQEDEAVCGAVGDCNTVQESDYARLLGVLPIGILGLIGYVGILGTWAFSLQAETQRRQLAHAAGFGMALFGTAFSIYLTFLEPFVIGATCAWCITSALLMLLILVLLAPAGWAAMNELLLPARPAPRHRTL